MANVLTETEAAIVLRCAEDDPNLLDLLPQVDSYLERATGRNWALDSPVHALAKSGARMLLVRWHEDPGGLAAGSSLSLGLSAVLVQLESLALRYVTFRGRSGSGSVSLPVARLGDTVASVVGKVGATGDQSASFETVITVDGYIQQLSGQDLSLNWYTAELIPPEAM